MIITSSLANIKYKERAWRVFIQNCDLWESWKPKFGSGCHPVSFKNSIEIRRKFVLKKWLYNWSFCQF
jgi:hypothetical protein